MGGYPQYNNVMNNKEVESEVTIEHKSELIEQLNSNDENTKHEEQSYATYFDYKKYNAAMIQNQSSNLLKFSIDLMGSGKNNTEIYSDKRRIKQILINLVGNALKFTERGSISIEYNIISDKNLVEIVVRDTGVGISESLQPKLFKVYSTFDHNNGSNRHGVGLGLAICKKLAQQLGPEKNIRLTSTKGDGSSFSFLIYQDIGIAIKKYRQKLNSYSDVEDSQQINDEINNKNLISNSNQNEIKKDHEKESQKNLFDVDADANAHLKTKCEFSPNMTAITNDQIFELNSNQTNRQKKILSLGNQKVTFDEFTLNSNSQRQFINERNHNHTSKSDYSKFYEKSNDYIQESNLSPLMHPRQQSDYGQEGLQENVLSNYQLNYNKKQIDENQFINSDVKSEKSGVFDSIDIDEQNLERKQTVNQFSHQLGTFASDQTNTNLQHFKHKLTQQQQSLYLPGRDGRNIPNLQNTSSQLQNSLQSLKGLNIKQFDQILNLKQNDQNQDFLPSPKSSSIFYHNSNFKAFSMLNDQQQSQLAKTSESGIRNNSQSITKISAQLANKSLSKHGLKISNSQSNSFQQHQSYIYEFKRPVNILIVDDTTFNLIALKAMLKKVRNINLIVDAYNGKEALEKFKQNKFDLVLMDINMPIMDGQESMKHMRSYEKEQYYKSQKRLNSKHASFYSPVSKPEESPPFIKYQNSIIQGEVGENQNQDLILLDQCDKKQSQNGISGIINDKNINEENQNSDNNIQDYKHQNSNTITPLCLDSSQNKNSYLHPKQSLRQSRRIKTTTVDESPRGIFENNSPGLNKQSLLKQQQNSNANQNQILSRNNSTNSKVYWNAIIFAVTAYDQQQDIQKYLQAGANAHISKPIKLENLFQVINKFF